MNINTVIDACISFQDAVFVSLFRSRSEIIYRIHGFLYVFLILQ